MRDLVLAYQQHSSKVVQDIKEWKVKKKHVDELVRLERTIKEAFTIKNINIGLFPRTN
jgi:hypothetical protein